MKSVQSNLDAFLLSLRFQKERLRTPCKYQIQYAKISKSNKFYNLKVVLPHLFYSKAVRRQTRIQFA